MSKKKANTLVSKHPPLVSIAEIIAEPVKTSSAFILVSSCGLAILVLGVVVASGFSFATIWKVISAEESIRYWIAAIVGVSTSIIATVIYEFAVRRRPENERIKQLRAIADEGLLIGNLDCLQRLGRRQYRNYKIDCKLLPHPDSNFLRVVIEYSFEKSLLTSEVQFQYCRIRTEADREQIRDSYRNTLHLDYEFFEVIDETDFSVPGVISDSDYIVRTPVVTIDKKSFTLPLHRQVIDNEVIFRATIPREHYTPNVEAKLEFTVEFPLEKDSFHDFVFDIPLNSMKCTVDYSAVSADIHMAGNYYMSSHLGPTIVEKPHEKEDTLYVSDNGWVMPTSSLMFVWWLKENR